MWSGDIEVPHVPANAADNRSAQRCEAIRLLGILTAFLGVRSQNQYMVEIYISRSPDSLY